MSIFWIFFFLLFGLALLIKGADIFVDGSSGIARRLGISDFFIGVTLVALGTSLPELTVSLIAGFSNSGQLVVGNIIGSNIANIALILGICGLITTIKIKSETLVRRDIPFVILSGVVLFILGFDRIFRNHHGEFNRLSMVDGLILLVFFMIFLYCICGSFKRSRDSQEGIEEKGKIRVKESWFILAAQIIGGLVAVIVGGKLVVDNAISLASILGVSQGVIGFTIVAIGTSLPEAVTTIVALIKKKEDIAIGNIIGSNTMNIFFILGLSASLTPLELSNSMMVDVIVMISISVLLFLIGYFCKAMGKYSGILFLCCYVTYIGFVIWRQ